MAVVTPSWKLAYFPEQGEGRLYDRVADPAEQNDLFAAACGAGTANATAEQAASEAVAAGGPCMRRR